MCTGDLDHHFPCLSLCMYVIPMKVRKSNYQVRLSLQYTHISVKVNMCCFWMDIGPKFGKGKFIQKVFRPTRSFIKSIPGHVSRFWTLTPTMRDLTSSTFKSGRSGPRPSCTTTSAATWDQCYKNVVFSVLKAGRQRVVFKRVFKPIHRKKYAFLMLVSTWVGIFRLGSEFLHRSL
jgi:hypothetical protein